MKKAYEEKLQDMNNGQMSGSTSSNADGGTGAEEKR